VTVPKWWSEYRFQRTKGHGVRVSLWRAFRYEPPPAAGDLKREKDRT
jgi:hypothetical protein